VLIVFELSHPYMDWLLTNPIEWRDLAVNASDQPEPRFGHGAVALSEASFAVIGGSTLECTALCNCTGEVLSDTWIWDLVNSTWSSGPMLPHPLFGLVVGVLDHGNHRIIIAYV
jgi:hypothetical protein